MGFKLGSSRINPLKNKGFLNQSPFTSSGNTMAYIKDGEDPIDNTNGSVKPTTGDPGDPPEKTEKQKEADAKAKKEAKANMKVVRTETNKVGGGVETIEYLEGEGKGKTFAEAGVDPAKAKAYWDDNPDKYEEYLANKKLTDQNRTFVPDDKPEPSEKITYTTSETPRPKPKAQDYITGEGDKVFVPQQKQRAMKLSKALTGKADSFGFKKVKGEKLQQLKDEYDDKVLASRAKKGKMGAEYLTLAEQEAKGSDQVNKKGAGRSSIVDTKSGEGIRKGEIAVKDSKGNMMYVNRKKGTSRPASPKNDIKTEIKKDKVVNASTIDGKDTTV